MNKSFVLTPAAAGGASPVELDEQQRAVVDHRGGPLLVVGGPGTGKTTTLVESVATRVGPLGDLSGHLVLTWSRPAAQRLRRHLVSRLGRTQLAPKVMTFHGLCHALVRRFGTPDEEGRPRQVQVLTAPEQEFRVRELLAGHPMDDWPEDLQAAARTRAFAGEVRAVLARTRQLGMDPDEVVRAGQLAGRPEWQLVGDFFDEYLDVLDAEGVVDYAELVHRSRLLMLDEHVRRQLGAELSTVHVDEFCEADPSQLALLSDLVGLGLDLVCFADPTTAVFGFRGAHARAVLDFDDLFAAPGRPTRRIDLLVNHRNPGAVVETCGRVRAKLPVNGAAPLARPVVEVEPGGGDQPGKGVSADAVRARVHSSATSQYEHVAEILRRAHLVDGLPWNQMAVVTRSGRGDLPVLTRALATAGVPVEVDGDELALSDEAGVRPLLMGLEAALRLASDQPLEAEVVMNLLRSPMFGLDAVALRRVGRRLRAMDGQQNPSPVLIARLVADPSQARAFVDDDDQLDPEIRPLVGLGTLLAQVAGCIARGQSVQSVVWALWDGTSWPARLRSEALEGSDSSRRAHRDLDAVCALFDLAAREESLVGEKGVRALLAQLGGQQIPEDTARESDLRHRGVRLVTAHRVKGEEWALVVVAGVQEGAWPNLARRGTLLEADRLSPDGVLPPTPTSSVLADERRLFHLACSRATRQLVVTAVGGDGPEAEQPSRFLSELGVEVELADGGARRAMTLPALVAELRRVVTDPASPPDLREAAAVRLAWLADEVDRDGHPIAPGARPESWWGVLDHSRAEVGLARPGEPIVLQSSQVQALLECPRQWFLSRQARAEKGSRSAANVGTVIHLLAQHALSDDLDRAELSERLDEVWDQISFDALWLGDSERLEADAALDRFSAWAQAAEAREVVGVEVSFSTPVEVDGEVVVVNGSVDRLEKDSEGRLRVVDFKTGRVVPSAESVRSMDQMGIYQLAVQQGAFDELTGGERRVGGAELVYLRKQDGAEPWPKVLSQPSLDEVPHLDADQDPGGSPTWVHERIARAARIIRSESFPATRCGRCTYCSFAIGCPATAIAPEVAP